MRRIVLWVAVLSFVPCVYAEAKFPKYSCIMLTDEAKSWSWYGAPASVEGLWRSIESDGTLGAPAYYLKILFRNTANSRSNEENHQGFFTQSVIDDFALAVPQSLCKP